MLISFFGDNTKKLAFRLTPIFNQKLLKFSIKQFKKQIPTFREEPQSCEERDDGDHCNGLDRNNPGDS